MVLRTGYGSPVPRWEEAGASLWVDYSLERDPQGQDFLLLQAPPLHSLDRPSFPKGNFE